MQKSNSRSPVELTSPSLPGPTIVVEIELLYPLIGIEISSHQQNISVWNFLTVSANSWYNYSI